MVEDVFRMGQLAKPRRKIMTNLYLDIIATLSLTDDGKSYKFATVLVDYNHRTGYLSAHRGTRQLHNTYAEALAHCEKSGGKPCGKNRWKMD
jgi:hypothetical protein